MRKFQVRILGSEQCKAGIPPGVATLAEDPVSPDVSYAARDLMDGE